MLALLIGGQLLSSIYPASTTSVTTDSLYRCLRSNRSMFRTDCVFNVPSNFQDLMPQHTKFGLGYYLIEFVNDKYGLYILLLRSLLTFIDVESQSISYSSTIQQKNHFRQVLKKTLQHIITKIEPLNCVIVYYQSSMNSAGIIIDSISHDNYHMLQTADFNLIGRFTLDDAISYIQFNRDQNDNLIDEWWFGPSLTGENQMKMIVAMLFNSSGLIFAEFNISDLDIDQCDKSSSFGQTNKCPSGSKCNALRGSGFTLGAYNCVCTNHMNQQLLFDGQSLELEYFLTGSIPSRCQYACFNQNGSCPLAVNKRLRFAIEVTQIAFVTLSIIQAAIIFYLRNQKFIKIFTWKLSLIILLGCIQIYCSVIVMIMRPNAVTCVLKMWFRRLGFVIVYGTSVLRLYKLLVEFQSRKARSINLKDKDLLQYLLIMIGVVTIYLCAWTLVNLDYFFDTTINFVFLYQGVTRDGLSFVICQPRWWDYFAEILEFAFLCVGLHLIYCTKTAPTEYVERKVIVTAIYSEIICNTACYLIRFALWRTTNPDIIILIFFVHSHLTITLPFLLNFYIKILYNAFNRSSKNSTQDKYQSSNDLNEPEFSGIKFYGCNEMVSVAEMDTEDIKVELKRLYNVIHTLKLQNMRQGNPHLPKKSMKRKYRRFSVQAAFLRKRLSDVADQVISEGTDQHAKTTTESGNNIKTQSSINVEKSQLF